MFLISQHANCNACRKNCKGNSQMSTDHLRIPTRKVIVIRKLLTTDLAILKILHDPKQKIASIKLHGSICRLCGSHSYSMYLGKWLCDSFGLHNGMAVFLHTTTDKLFSFNSHCYAICMHYWLDFPHSMTVLMLNFVFHQVCKDL